MLHMFGGFFQLGYVTRDLDAALYKIHSSIGPSDFLVNEPMPIDGVPAPTRRIALAYFDDVMTEIIEPDPAQATIYDDFLADDHAAIRLHHLGYLIEDTARTMQRLDENCIPVSWSREMPGALDFIYADTRTESGHYSEFIRLDEGGKAFFSSLPRHRTGVRVDLG